MFFEARRRDQEHVSILYTLSARVCVECRVAFASGDFLIGDCGLGLRIAGSGYRSPTEIAGCGPGAWVGNRQCNLQSTMQSAISNAICNQQSQSTLGNRKIGNLQSTIDNSERVN
jgi:hypothetical protein